MFRICWTILVVIDAQTIVEEVANIQLLFQDNELMIEVEGNSRAPKPCPKSVNICNGNCDSIISCKCGGITRNASEMMSSGCHGHHLDEPCECSTSLLQWQDKCNGFCGQGEGDCDRDSDCLNGLVCKFDWWWGVDFCEAGPQTVNYAWTDFGEWGECSVACGGVGVHERMRTCIEPVNGGYPCPSQMETETEACDNGPCPVDGGFSDWDEWTECTVSCGEGGTQSRSRACDSPSPEFGGANCVGETSEMQSCNEQPCPVDGGFSDWDEWTECSVTCGGGDRTRQRRCDNPAPAFGGQECEGVLSDCEPCNKQPCPSQCPALLLETNQSSAQKFESHRDKVFFDRLGSTMRNLGWKDTPQDEESLVKLLSALRASTSGN